jgi:hypothetical protein
MRRFAGVLGVLPILLASWLFAEPPRGGEVLESFPVPGDGDLLIVPVTIQGKQYPFIVDTGASLTVYDTTLLPLLGPCIGSVTVSTPRGNTKMNQYTAPEASVGKLPLPRTGPVLVSDQTMLWPRNEVDVRGVLGMDFLKQYVVRIDFDGGTLTFQSRLGQGEGHRFPLHSGHVKDAPFVDADVSGMGPPERFLVDTGCRGKIFLVEDLFSSLVTLNKVEWVTNQISSTGKTAWGHLTTLKMGRLEHRRLLVSTCRGSVLGLDFLSRYCATFDFPAGYLYLQKGKRFDKADVLNRTGLCLERRSGKTVISVLHPDSPAEKAGIKVGDVLVSVAGLEADLTRIYALRERFCVVGENIPVTLTRGAKLLKLLLKLKEDRPVTARANGKP